MTKFNPCHKPKRRKRVDNVFKTYQKKTLIEYDEKPDSGSEATLQSRVESYLEYKHDIRVIRIPDLAYMAIFNNSRIPDSVRSIVSKYLSGLPDLILLKRADKLYCKALLIELKSKTGDANKKQVWFAEIVPVHKVRSFDLAVKLIEGFDKC